MTTLARTYPMTTSKLNLDEPSKPTTLFEHFRADPLGCTSFAEYVKKTKDSANVVKT